MAQKSISGSQDLAKMIKLRRNELNLTIEEAASRAGVGTKTWCRYETGASIRSDKCKGICKALNWRTFPSNETSAHPKSIIDEYKDHEAWSTFLADTYGTTAAISFAIGSDLLLDSIEQDLSDISSMPAGSHIGQLDTSFIRDELPPQFLIQYDYNFLYQMKCTLIHLRMNAKHGASIIAHSVIDELIIYLCNEEAKTMFEISSAEDRINDEYDFDDSSEWIFDMFDDMDIITFLYSDIYLDKSNPYHFTHWFEQQFYTE